MHGTHCCIDCILYWEAVDHRLVLSCNDIPFCDHRFYILPLTFSLGSIINNIMILIYNTRLLGR